MVNADDKAVTFILRVPKEWEQYSVERVYGLLFRQRETVLRMIAESAVKQLQNPVDYAKVRAILSEQGI